MKRKRSAYVGFSLMTVSAALIGCERPDPEPPASPGPTQAAAPVAYQSMEDCLTQNSRAECDTAFQQARAEHDQTAPKFADQASCEQDWGVGNCENRPDQAHGGGGSIFMPVLAGFLIGRALGGGGMFGAPLTRRGGALYSGGRPVGAARAGGGFARSGGFIPGATRSAPARVQRGGFGQTSSYRGSGG